jgi:CheY-like chemotaxis protein
LRPDEAATSAAGTETGPYSGERTGESNPIILIFFDSFWPSEGRGHKFESCRVRQFSWQVSAIPDFGVVPHSGHSVTNKASRKVTPRAVESVAEPFTKPRAAHGRERGPLPRMRRTDSADAAQYSPETSELIPVAVNAKEVGQRDRQFAYLQEPPPEDCQVNPVSLIVFVASQLPEHENLRELTTGLGREAEVRIYKDPYELLSGAAARPPDLLITDGHLSGMSARELLDRFRSCPACSDVPAMVLVAYDSDGWREVSFTPGITEFAIMPVDRGELTLRSKHLLSSRTEQKSRGKPPSPERATESPDVKAAVADPMNQIKALDGLIQTLSAKLLAKIAEIDRLRGELQNLVDATSIAAVFLDRQACVRHFTPQIESFYELSNRDIGKPLQEIPCKLGYSGLVEDICLAQATGSPVERYFEQPTSETYFLMRISPNRSRDQTIWGMTVTFIRVNLPSPGRA